MKINFFNGFILTSRGNISVQVRTTLYLFTIVAVITLFFNSLFNTKNYATIGKKQKYARRKF